MQSLPAPPADMLFMGEKREKFFEATDEILKSATNGIDTKKGLVLDVGCGYGRIAYGLLRSGDDSPYIGVDILKRQISWLQENITPLVPQCQFKHLDIHNGRYNPNGKLQASDFSLGEINEPVATIYCLSVFTHMYESDIIAYLKEFKRVMNKDTIAIVTAFVLSSPAARGYKFEFELNDHCRYCVQADPLHAIGYTEEWFRGTLAEIGLKAKMHYGFQDRLEISLAD